MNPTWFDWLSLIVTVFSIIFAYFLGERNYKRQLRKKKREHKELIVSENNLFVGIISKLSTIIQKQLTNLTTYKEAVKEKNNSLVLEIETGFQIAHLEFLNLKSLYEEYNSKELNELLMNLFGLGEINNLLSEEMKSFLNSYNSYDKIFKKNYRLVLYSNFFGFSNARAENYKIEKGIKKWQYSIDDKFMQEYYKLRQVDILNEKSLADKTKINKNLLLPFIELSGKFIPEDYNAIETYNIANEAHSAFIDMENLEIAHLNVINSYIDTLTICNDKIENILNK